MLIFSQDKKTVFSESVPFAFQKCLIGFAQLYSTQESSFYLSVFLHNSGIIFEEKVVS